MAQRGSDRHGPRIDDAMAREVSSLTQGAPNESRAEEGRQHEAPSDGEPEPDARLAGDRAPGPAGELSRDELGARSDLARHLTPKQFPATKAGLLAALAASHASDPLIERLQRLPDDVEYANVAAVWAALGGHREHRGPS